jgi:hypothetical protein
MSLIDLLLRIIFAGLALILFSVSILSYRRHLEWKLALISFSYLAYAALAILLLLSGLFNWPGLEMGITLIVLSIVALLLQYISIARS